MLADLKVRTTASFVKRRWLRRRSACGWPASVNISMNQAAISSHLRVRARMSRKFWYETLFVLEFGEVP